MESKRVLFRGTNVSQESYTPPCVATGLCLCSQDDPTAHFKENPTIFCVRMGNIFFKGHQIKYNL